MQQSALAEQAEQWALSEPDVMDLAGRLDDGTAPDIEQDALLCIKSGARRMLLDCRDLAYITGAGMRAVLAVARAMGTAEGQIALCGLQPQVEAMFRVTGIGAMIPVYNDRHEAIAALGA